MHKVSTMLRVPKIQTITSVAGLRNHIAKLPTHFQVDVVVVSPMTRTLETAVGLFGGDTVDVADGHKLLMRAQSEQEGVRTEQKAIVAQSSVPFIAHEACREQTGLHPCDHRRTVSYYQHQFPSIDFSLVESDSDTLYDPMSREPNYSVVDRVWTFLKPERHIAVVTHAAFLRILSQCFEKDLREKYGTTARDELVQEFRNCELRSIQLLDCEVNGASDGRCAYSHPGGEALLQLT
ncbi:unnamed protein product [Ostreobium quekettii]|uniref:Phosphoglycerate mutase-like protein n=1 Tax=Ostreobium quekettii TaxID=121088 RepID=A0A8S1IV01_9CHLO|nr:unnamed protein product [Ostreobium quekettii]